MNEAPFGISFIGLQERISNPTIRS